MPLFELTGKALTEVETSSFTELGLKETPNLQVAIAASIRSITPGVTTMVLADEYSDWVGVNRRIDLLCLDEDGYLVVVELKREGPTHMELQAVRYAAMVSAMRFDQAVSAHSKYLRKLGSDQNAEEAIRDFLGGRVENFNRGVRIVLAASSFNPEVTTAVLWLNSHSLDIRCVQLRPHLVDQRVLVDIQQVIPLPEAANYQVALREKAQEQELARTSSKDKKRYDLTIGDETIEDLPKRKLVYRVVDEAIRRGVTPESIMAALPGRYSTLFLAADGMLNEEGVLDAFPDKDLGRYFAADQELFHFNGRTYALSNQWGADTLEAVDRVIDLVPGKEAVRYHERISSPSEIVYRGLYKGYEITKEKSGSVKVFKDGEEVPAHPMLRGFATELGVDLKSDKGGDKNTRTLGSDVIKAILATRQ